MFVKGKVVLLPHHAYAYAYASVCLLKSTALAMAAGCRDTLSNTALRFRHTPLPCGTRTSRRLSS